jgi:hypothetical protein
MSCRMVDRQGATCCLHLQDIRIFYPEDGGSRFYVTPWMLVDRYQCFGRKLPPPYSEQKVNHVSNYTASHSRRQWSSCYECSAVCSENRIKPTERDCGGHSKLMNVKIWRHTVTTATPHYKVSTETWYRRGNRHYLQFDNSQILTKRKLN